jgi:hypothetical protein
LRLFFKARAPDWTGFVKTQTFAVYWAVTIPLVFISYTAIQTQPAVKLMTFAVAGSIIGSQEHLLRHAKAGRQLHKNLLNQHL